MIITEKQAKLEYLTASLSGRGEKSIFLPLPQSGAGREPGGLTVCAFALGYPSVERICGQWRCSVATFLLKI